MKQLFVTLLLITVIVACNSKYISPEKLVGKWSPAYQIQKKNAEGNWSEWSAIDTYPALPDIEFTIDGKFLVDGQPGAGCCSSGNKYTVSGNTIIFSEFASCPNFRCMPCYEWEVKELNAQTLVLESCNNRRKYAKAK